VPEDGYVDHVVAHDAPVLRRQGLVLARQMIEHVVVFLLGSGRGSIVLQNAGGTIVDVVIVGVADAVRSAAVVRELCAVEVILEVVEDVLLLVVGKPVQGVFGYPVVGAVVGVGGVGAVSAVGVGGGWG